MKRGAILTALIMLSALLLGGCGGSSGIKMPGNPFDPNEFIWEEGYSVDEALKTIRIQDAEHLTYFLPDKYRENPSYDQLREAIRQNENLDDTVRGYLESYVDRLETAGYNIDLRPFYMNLSTVKVAYVSNAEMVAIAGGGKGVFMPDQHMIYLNEEDNSVPLDFLLPHEISHMLSNLYFDYKGYTAIRDFCVETYGFTVEEGLDSLFADTLIGEDPIELPYRVCNNYCRVLMEATDYSFETYINKCIYDYREVLNQENANGSGVDGDTIIHLLEGATRDYRLNEYAAENYEELDRAFSWIYFEHTLSSTSSKDEVKASYDRYREILDTQTANGSFMNADIVKSTLQEVLTQKGSQVVVDF
ncbi:MAG: hypothetical protein K6A92_01975 [Lachnospiraceae bacterium]|nr:hypothetical protein [Lachnospiraceae bacterium]